MSVTITIINKYTHNVLCGFSIHLVSYCSFGLTADALIDLEWHTNVRWGLADGPIQWADLGERPDHVCE